MGDKGAAAVPAILLGLGYMLPTLIAYGRNVEERIAITAVNVLLGWTIVGWVVTSIWAMTAELPKAELVGRPRKS